MKYDEGEGRGREERWKRFRGKRFGGRDSEGRDSGEGIQGEAIQGEEIQVEGPGYLLLNLLSLLITNFILEVTYSSGWAK